MVPTQFVLVLCLFYAVGKCNFLITTSSIMVFFSRRQNSVLERKHTCTTLKQNIEIEWYNLSFDSELTVVHNRRSAIKGTYHELFIKGVTQGLAYTIVHKRKRSNKELRKKYKTSNLFLVMRNKIVRVRKSDKIVI